MSERPFTFKWHCITASVLEMHLPLSFFCASCTNFAISLFTVTDNMAIQEHFWPEIYPPLLCLALDSILQLVIGQCFPEPGKSWGGQHQGGASWGLGLILNEIHKFWTEQCSQLLVSVQHTLHVAAIPRI